MEKACSIPYQTRIMAGIEMLIGMAKVLAQLLGMYYGEGTAEALLVLFITLR